MSTRSAIARIQGDGWKGVYHHWDGYPTSLGETLFKRAQQIPVTDMLRFLIDEHPAGWSTINSCDWEAAPGFKEEGFTSEGPECYCHGGRSEETASVTHEDDMGMEWAYVFDEQAKTMAVLERVYPAGDGAKIPADSHATGFFGTLGVDPDTQERDDAWVIRTVVPLDGPEPNWEQIEGTR